jgi:predicted CXXCH cytochrome family protein
VPSLAIERVGVGAARTCRLVVVASLLAIVPAPGRPAENPYQLRPGANGALCLDCHAPDMGPILQRAFVHTPVRARDCTGCHSPHVSHRRKLLAADIGQVCSTCHAVVPAPAVSTHRPVAEGRCTACHDPHASSFKYNLVQDPGALCATCHPAIAEAARAEFRHAPVERGCKSCHDPHGSAKAPRLLKAPVPALCIGCHRADRLASVHGGYPVVNARCTSCHDPHGSSVPRLLYATVHPPVLKRNCAQCHEPPTSKAPFRTRRAGAELCRGCHTERIARMLERSRVHSPVAAGACLDCHSPHAAPQRGLVKASMVAVCGRCHADTIRRQAVSPTKHKPIAAGSCTRCHDPHGSDAPLLLARQDVIGLCLSCHDWQKHATHVLGERHRDPRNPNLTISCLSCHRAHGTEYEHLTPFPGKNLCTNCHEGGPKK